MDTDTDRDMLLAAGDCLSRQGFTGLRRLPWDSTYGRSAALSAESPCGTPSVVLVLRFDGHAEQRVFEKDTEGAVGRLSSVAAMSRGMGWGGRVDVIDAILDGDRPVLRHYRSVAGGE